MNRAYSNLTRASGSKSFMPADLSVVDAFEKIEETYLQMLGLAVSAAIQEYEQEVQAIASQEDNWGELGSSLSVTFDSTDYSINVGVLGTNDTVNQAMELEYGNGVLPPNPMIRNAAIGVTTDFPSILNRYV